MTPLLVHVTMGLEDIAQVLVRVPGGDNDDDDVLANHNEKQAQSCTVMLCPHQSEAYLHQMSSTYLGDLSLILHVSLLPCQSHLSYIYPSYLHTNLQNQAAITVPDKVMKQHRIELPQHPRIVHTVRPPLPQHISSTENTCSASAAEHAQHPACRLL